MRARHQQEGSGSASNWLTMKGGKMVACGQEGRKHGQGAKTSLAGVNAAGRAERALGGRSDDRASAGGDTRAGAAFSMSRTVRYRSRQGSWILTESRRQP